MGSDVLIKGRCIIENADNSFVYVKQNRKEAHYRFKHSQNWKFIVVWAVSINPLQDTNKQVCLIEKRNAILWCKNFEIVELCDVSNNGITVVLFHRLISTVDVRNRPGFLVKRSLVIISKGGDESRLEFAPSEEISAFAISEDGRHLVYNLDLKLIFYDVDSKKEKWAYRYSEKQVVHDLVFKDDRILVYAGQNPSAYVDRRYCFSLDLNGEIVSNDIPEMKKQEIRDLLSDRAIELADQVGEILRESLTDVAPTIEVDKRRFFGTKESSLGWSKIMSGRCLFPALHITLTPILHQFFVEPDHARIEDGCQFHLNIYAVARTAQERDEVSRNCIHAIEQKMDYLAKKQLVFEGKLRSEKIGFYPGSGAYFRTHIGCILNFPAKQTIEKKRDWRDLLVLQSNESIITQTEAHIKSPLGKLAGKLVLTTKKLVILIKNPISDEFKTVASLSPVEVRNIVFVSDGAYVFLEGASKEPRVYFNSECDFEIFREKFESFKKGAMTQK